MLVLSRKLGEKIYINENICITVVDIDRGKIRLGIEAPAMPYTVYSSPTDSSEWSRLEAGAHNTALSERAGLSQGGQTDEATAFCRSASVFAAAM